MGGWADRRMGGGEYRLDAKLLQRSRESRVYLTVRLPQRAEPGNRCDDGVSNLAVMPHGVSTGRPADHGSALKRVRLISPYRHRGRVPAVEEIGRASCRERV